MSFILRLQKSRGRRVYLFLNDMKESQGPLVSLSVRMRKISRVSSVFFFKNAKASRRLVVSFFLKMQINVEGRLESFSLRMRDPECPFIRMWKELGGLNIFFSRKAKESRGLLVFF